MKRSAMRFIGSLALMMLLVGIGASQDMGKKISYTGPAGRASTVLADISNLAGVTLRTGSSVSNDIIVAQFKEASVADVMKKLAEALDAEWAQESDGWRLVRSETIRLRQQRAEIAERAKQLTSSLKASTDVAKLDQSFDSAAAKKMADDAASQLQKMMQDARGGERQITRTAVRGFQDMNTQQPGGRAVLKMLSAMRMEDLAALKPGTRTVFSTNPTNMQKRLGNNAVNVMKQFVQEQQTFDHAMTDAMSNLQAGRSGDTPMFMLPGMGGRNRTPNPNAVATKGLMIVTRFGNSDSLSCQLVVADQEGEYIAQGFFSLGVDDDEDPAKVEGKDGEKPVELSQLSKEFIQLVKDSMPAGQAGEFTFIAIDDNGGDAVTVMGSNLENAAAPKLSKEWRERLTNPDKFEPMSTVPSDIFNGFAKSSDLNMVALLPDDLLMQLSRRLVGGGSLKPTEIAGQLSSLGLVQKSAEGWTLITPRKPDEIRDLRIDRKALAHMYRTLASNGRLTLDDMAANAIAQPENPSPMSFDEFFSSQLDPSSSSRGIMRRFGNQQQMLRFYGSLGASQKSALKNGQPLAYSGMNPAQRNLVHSMVFNSMDGPRIDQRGNGRGGQRTVEMQMEVRNGMAMMSGGNLGMERTEVLSTGIPAPTVLTLQVQNEQAVLASAPNGRTQILNAEGVAQQKLRTEMPQMARFGGEGPAYDKFQSATQSNYNFLFRMAPVVSLSRQLQDNVVDARSSAVAYNALAGDFKRQVDRAYDRMKQMMSNMRIPGGGDNANGGGNIPPAPLLW